MLLAQRWTLAQWALVLLNLLKRFKYKICPTQPKIGWVLEDNNLQISADTKLGIFIHIYYEDYIPSVIKLMNEIKSLPVKSKFHVTSPFDEILRQIQEECPSSDLVEEQTIYRVTPNRGRNFGPLFSEFGNNFNEFDYVIHLHSKKSHQNNQKRSRAWADINWNLLGLDGTLLLRLLKLFVQEKNLGFSFSLDWAVTPPHSFNWGLNRKQADKLLLALGISKTRHPFLFPAGGMFLARPEVLSSISALNLDYEDFPIESGQLDGTLQHVVERLVGVTSSSLGLDGLVYHEPSNKFGIPNFDKRPNEGRD